MNSMRTILFVVLAAVIVMIRPAGAADETDLARAITIGSGPKTVIEFTDPDCPFCRKASKYFDSRPDVTRHVFFYPLARHEKAREKAQTVLSLPDKARAYHEVMSGKMDAALLPVPSEEGVHLLEQHIRIAKKSKVVSTPTFLINGRIIVGFDLRKIEDALGGNSR